MRVDVHTDWPGNDKGVSTGRRMDGASGLGMQKEASVWLVPERRTKGL